MEVTSKEYYASQALMKSAGFMDVVNTGYQLMQHKPLMHTVGRTLTNSSPYFKAVASNVGSNVNKILNKAPLKVQAPIRAGLGAASSAAPKLQRGLADATKTNSKVGEVVHKHFPTFSKYKGAYNSLGTILTEHGKGF